MNKENLITWQALEYEFKEKTADWFWAVIIIVLSGGIASIIYKNSLFAIFLFLAAGLLLVFSLRKPKIINFEIGTEGLKIKDDFFSYNQMANFWIDEHHSHLRLLINTDKFTAPLIDIRLPDEINPDEVKKILLEKIEEKEIKEPLSHKVMDFLGF